MLPCVSQSQPSHHMATLMAGKSAMASNISCTHCSLSPPILLQANSVIISGFSYSPIAFDTREHRSPGSCARFRLDNKSPYYSPSNPPHQHICPRIVHDFMVPLEIGKERSLGFQTQITFSAPASAKIPCMYRYNALNISVSREYDRPSRAPITIHLIERPE